MIAYGIVCTDPNNDGDQSDSNCGAGNQRLIQGDTALVVPFEMSATQTVMEN